MSTIPAMHKFSRPNPLMNGDAVVLRNLGSKGWERSKLDITYVDYTFFKVDVDVKSELVN